MAEAESESKSGAVPDSAESQQPETPTNIQTQDNSVKYEDIELPDNSNHKAIIEVNYKRYIFILGGIVFLLIGSLFASGLLSIQNTELATIISSALIVPIFILFWLFEQRANN